MFQKNSAWNFDIFSILSYVRHFKENKGALNLMIE